MTHRTPFVFMTHPLVCTFVPHRGAKHDNANVDPRVTLHWKPTTVGPVVRLVAQRLRLLQGYGDCRHTHMPGRSVGRLRGL